MDSLGNESQESDELVPPGVTTKEFATTIGAIKTTLDPKPQWSPLPTSTKGIENAKKRLRAFSIQKKSPLVPVPIPKPLNTGSSTVLIGKLSSSKLTQKPELEPDQKKIAKPPKPGSGSKKFQDAYSQQRRTKSEIEDMKRKMELVELGIPLGLICPSATSDTAMPSKAMPPIKSFLDPSKVDELISEAKKTIADGKEFKFDYQKLLPDYDNPFQRKKDDVQQESSRTNDDHRKEDTARSRDKKEKKEYKSDRHEKKYYGYDKYSRDKRDTQRDKVDKHNSKKTQKTVKETDVDLNEFVVCDSWSLDNDDKKPTLYSPTAEEISKSKERSKTSKDAKDDISQCSNKQNSTPKKYEKLHPVIDSFKFEIDPIDEAIELDEDSPVIEKFAKPSSKKESLYSSPVDIKLFDYDQDISKDGVIDANDDTFLESVINEIKLENMSDDTSQDKGLVEYDMSPKEDDYDQNTVDTSQGSVTPELDDRMRDLQSSQQSHYSDGYRSTESYKSTETGYKSTESGYKSSESGYKSSKILYKSTESGYQPLEAGYKSSEYKSNESGYKPTESEYRSSESRYTSTESGHKSTESGYRSTESGYKSKSAEGSHKLSKRSYKSNETSYNSGETGYRGEMAYKSDGSYKTADSGYKAIGEYKSDRDFKNEEGGRSVSGHSEFRLSVEKELDDALERNMGKSTVDSLETWSFVLKICQPLLFRHDRNKCYKETETTPKVWYTENPKGCSCVKDRSVVYQELEMCKMTLVDRVYGCDQSSDDGTEQSPSKVQPNESVLSCYGVVPQNGPVPLLSIKIADDSICATSRSWYPQLTSCLPNCAGCLTGCVDVPVSSPTGRDCDWETDEPRASVSREDSGPATPRNDEMCLDTEYQRFMKAVWPEQEKCSKETSRSTTPIRQEGRKKKKLEEVEKEPEEKKKKRIKLSSEGWSQESDLEEESVKKSEQDTQFTEDTPQVNVEAIDSLDECKKQKNEKEKIRKRRRERSSTSSSSSDSEEASKKKKKSKKDNKKTKAKLSKRRRVSKKIKKKLKAKRRKIKKKLVKEENLSEDSEEEEREKKKDKKLKKKNQLKLKKVTKKKKAKARSSSSSSSTSDLSSSDSEVERKRKVKKKDIRHKKNADSSQEDSTDSSDSEDLFDENILNNIKTERLTDDEKIQSMNDFSPRRQKPREREIINVKELQNDFVGKTILIKQEKEDTPEVESKAKFQEVDKEEVDIRDDVKELTPDDVDGDGDDKIQEPQHVILHELSSDIPLPGETNTLISDVNILDDIDMLSNIPEPPKQKTKKILEVKECKSIPVKESETITVQESKNIPDQESHIEVQQSQQSYAYNAIDEHNDDELFNKAIDEDCEDKFPEGYDQENYEMYEHMAMIYQNKVANQMSKAVPSSTQSVEDEIQKIETVVRCRLRGEIKCDWRAGESLTTSQVSRPSRWGLKPGEVNIVLTGGPAPVPPVSVEAPATSEAQYAIPTVCEPVYQIQSLASNRNDAVNASIGYDEAYLDTYGAADLLQYGDCFAEPQCSATEARSDLTAPETPSTDPAPTPVLSSLDIRINKVLQETALGDVAKETDSVEDETELPGKGILITKSLGSGRSMKRVSFADGYTPGQDSDTEEPPVRKKKKMRRLGCAWPCPATHPDHVPLWDALPPPPPPAGPPPGLLAVPPGGVHSAGRSPPPGPPPRAAPLHLLRRPPARPPLVPIPHPHMHQKFDPSSGLPAFMPPEPPPGLISFP